MARRAQRNTGWTVVLLPDGTREEAEAAARRARRLVATWIIKNAQDNQDDNLDNTEMGVKA